jgi:hypothetical protein
MAYDVSQFDPLRPPSRRRQLWLLIAGPVVWVVALEVVAVVMHRTNLIGIGLVIAAASFLLGVLLLIPSRRRRLREEREGAPGR